MYILLVECSKFQLDVECVVITYIIFAGFLDCHALSISNHHWSTRNLLGNGKNTCEFVIESKI